MFGYFKSKKSKEQIKMELKSKLVRSVQKNWGKDCYIGKVKRNRFKLYYHRAYIKNSFNKTAYGVIHKKGNETRLYYILISPLLHPVIYLIILGISIYTSWEYIGTTDFVHNVISSTMFLSSLPLFLGIISQAIPSHNKKKMIDELLEAITTYDNDKVDS